MKILLVNKFYYMSGGAERYLFDWENLLRDHGHEVAVFAMRHPLNRPCEQSSYFVEQVRFDPDQSLTARLRAATHSIWSAEAARKLRRLIEEEGPFDIAHLNAIVYQITPSILRPLAERNIPIVQTCHEYSPICANQRLYNQRTNRICAACLRGGLLAPLWTRCVKGSFAASATACLATMADRLAARSRKRIRYYVATSSFMRDMLLRGGLQAERVRHIPNFVNAEAIPPGEQPGEYMLYFGRLVPQKGIETFIAAAAKRPDIPCRALGGGPMEDALRRRLAGDGPANVELLGHLEGEELVATLRGARAVVVPSEWYEPFGLVILEAWSAGRPVIASEIGGPAEIVSHERNGLLFPAGDAEALATAMQRLWQDAELAASLGRTGRQEAVTRYTPERHYESMMTLFKEARA